MKETPLNKAFEDAMRKMDSDPALHHVAEQLAMIQHAVLDFRDAGMEMTMTVRPEGRGFARELDDDGGVKPLANGEIVSGDLRLNFIVQKEGYYEQTMALKVFRDEEMLMERKSEFDEDAKVWREVAPESGDDDGGFDDEDDWNRDDKDEEKTPPEKAPPEDLKSAITRLLIDLKTRDGFASQFNVGPNGISGNAVEKPFPVAPPLKLKKPDAP
jgi:hypothetical protein